jgi:subtilisin
MQIKTTKLRVFTAMIVGVAFLLGAAGITPFVSEAANVSQKKIDVFIGFTNTPGPIERAFVQSHEGIIKHSYHLVPAIAASLPESVIVGLKKNPKVTGIEFDGTVYALDAELDNTWGVKRIGAGLVHDSGNKGTDIKVAIIDSGIDYFHPDLDANFAGGYDFVNSDTDPMDDNGHGTHVAGTAAAEDDGTGVVGVAPEAKLYALKVLDSGGSGSWSNVIAALQWAVDNGIPITNNSYGSNTDPGSTVKAAFDNSAAAGILHIAAAGNSGNCAGKNNKVSYPARYASVVAVAATNQDDVRPCFSSTGPAVELAAPGVDVNSTLLGGGYGTKSGTSVASPHVAGTAALVIAAGISDTNGDGKINDEVRKRLQETADDLGAVGKDNQYGYGLVDADEAAIINKAPSANDVSASTNEDTAVSITLSGSDVETCELSFVVVGGPANGGLGGITDNACVSGSPNTDSAVVTYTPNPNFNGSDAFTYKVNDGTTDSNIATVSVSVNAVNDTPVADSQNVTTEKNSKVTITLAGSDVDGCIASSTFAVTSAPANGALSATSGPMSCSGSGNLSASVDYTPKTDFVGDDSFKFNISDGVATGNEAAVSITVTEVNTAPTANDVSAVTDEDTAVTITLSGSDAESCELNFAVVDGPVNGTLGSLTNEACVSGTPNTDSAKITYTPNPNFNGSDAFTYKVNDGIADSNTATVSITVTSPVLLSENFEGDVSGWSASGLWHLANDTPCVSPGYKSATHSFYYGKESSCNYDTGKRNSGTLTSPSVSGLGSSATLSFWYWREVESYNGAYDKTYVQVSYNGGSTWSTVWYKDAKDASEKEWTFASISLTTGGSVMKVRFVFDTVDGVTNKFRGWLIDDIKVENN